MPAYPTARLAALKAALVMCGLMATQQEAHADLRICNQTTSRVGVAVGYRDDRGWVTEGWWNMTPGNCETLLQGALRSRFYYIYAIDYDRGGEWGGRHFMCTQPRAFTIRDVGDCVQRSYERTGFFEVDTGDIVTWTVDLTEPGRAGPSR